LCKMYSYRWGVVGIGPGGSLVKGSPGPVRRAKGTTAPAPIQDKKIDKCQGFLGRQGIVSIYS
jgi:hypothetical protein